MSSSYANAVARKNNNHQSFSPTSPSGPPVVSSPHTHSDKIPDVPSPVWEFHPLYGLVHAVDIACAECCSREEHIRIHKHDAEAMQVLHKHNDVSYHEGVAAGYQRGYIDGLEEGRRAGQTEQAACETLMDTESMETKEPALHVSASPHLAIDIPAASIVTPPGSHSSNSPRTSTTIGMCDFADQTSPPPRNRGNKSWVPGRRGEYYSAFRSELMEKQLLDLFAAAHRGDRVAHGRAVALAREAHNTPRDLKSWAQGFVLTEWRNPNGPNPRSCTERPSTHVANPRLDDSIDKWAEYYQVHNASFPRGVRRDVNGGPHLPDLQASRVFAQMRPVSGTPSTIRLEYTIAALDVILTPGLYRGLLQRLHLTIKANVDPVNYDGPQTVTQADVAKHFARCGISIEVLERDWAPWAEEYQRVQV